MKMVGLFTNLVLVVQALTLLLFVQAQDNATCAELMDWTLDSCDWAVDGLCDEDCETDCFDCDPCQAFRFTSCSTCAAEGCFWCPGDATCSSVPLEADFYDLYNKVSSCTAVEDWQTECSAVEEEENYFNDPLYQAEVWAYDLMNVRPVWEMGYSGAGVHVRVNDNGVDASHPEFAERFDVEHSCEVYMPQLEGDIHGTNCASFILAEANNGVCGAGIAPNATVSACIQGGNLSVPEMFMMHMEVVDISSNSWGSDSCYLKPEYLEEGTDDDGEATDDDGGATDDDGGVERRRRQKRRLQTYVCPFDPDRWGSPCETCGSDASTPECKEAIVNYCSQPANYEVEPLNCAEYLDLYVDCQYNVLDPAEGESLAQLVLQGRGGLGTIILFASGNQYEKGDGTNNDPLVSSRFTIGVAAVGKDGKHASYSTPGAGVLVAAPGSDTEYTTMNVAAMPGGTCGDAGDGTSFACPRVAGVVALMLEANPGLGWRDVQGILADTAQVVYPDDETWSENGAGLMFSPKYGYGIVDAAAAVNASLDWVNFGPEEQIMVESGPVNEPIQNDESETTAHSLTVERTDFVTESVVLYVNIKHGSRGDLQVELVSPSGTVSILHPSDRPEFTPQTGDERWKLVSVMYWYEDPAGDWTLTISDRDSQQVDMCDDLPFSFDFDFIEVLATIGCSNITQFEFCPDGTLSDQDRADLPEAVQTEITAACCDCGGGEILEGDDLLVDWTMIIYGHEMDEVATVDRNGEVFD